MLANGCGIRRVLPQLWLLPNVLFLTYVSSHIQALALEGFYVTVLSHKEDKICYAS